MSAADEVPSSRTLRFDDVPTEVAAFDAVPALPTGHPLQEFVIEGVLGKGGFGIVYQARDTRLQRRVALKEYMPATLAMRGRDLAVSARAPWLSDTFAVGLRSFVNEAQLLASFDHPSLLEVYRFWEENGTAYMVMPLYKGATLKAWLRDTGARPDESWLLGLLHPLIDALEHLHGAQPCCLHRDVAPDNVLLLGGKPHPGAASLPTPVRPLLLDFGAARRVIGDRTKTLTVFLKPGYAPVEQYGDSHAMTQGPWTDVYALSAVLYACIAGHAPDASIDRLLADDSAPAAKLGGGRYSARLLAAIDAGLRVRPEDRPQSMAEFRRLFPPPADAATPRPLAAAADDSPHPAARAQRWHVAAVRIARGARDGKMAWAAGALVLAAGIAWWRWPDATPLPVQATARPAAGGTDSEPSASAPGVVTAQAAAPVAGAAGVEAATAPDFSVMAALRDIVARSDPGIVVTARADQPTLVIGRDSLKFRVTSSIAGHLYVFSGGTDKTHFHLLFPNRLDQRNRVVPGAELVLPRQGWEITAAGPAGTNHLVLLVSPHERDLSGVGLRQTDQPIPEFDLAQARQLWQRKAAQSPFVGAPVCPGGCSDAFGATMLTVDEVAAATPRRN